MTVYAGCGALIGDACEAAAVPPEPWTTWSEWAYAWVCRSCGALSGFGVHGPGCRDDQRVPVDGWPSQPGPFK